MPSLWDQLYDAEILLRRAEQDGDTAAVDALHKRIEQLESQLQPRG
ncbi:MAG: hypothetical protein ACI38R_22710 [Rhodococcus sp. (in: high G+C Gram-positive bacteria)]